jgi:NADH:ubiquinone oxidoreductase subunit 6 (subunit J)
MMKKSILAPLSSALVIPGLGQILNQDLKKGGILLGLVFVLFLAGTVKLVLILRSVFLRPGANPPDPQRLLETVMQQDFTAVWIIVGLMSLIWLYSILDAFVTARRRERESLEDAP